MKETKGTAEIVHMSTTSRGVARRPRNILKNAVRRLDRQDDWERIIGRTPLVMDFAINMARYLAESVPAVNGRRPLLVSCIDRGVGSWLAAGAGARNEQRNFLAFIRGALYPLPEALEWTLSWDNGEHVAIWNPMEQCVCKWWTGKGGLPVATRRNRPEDSAYVALNPADYRLIVLARFLAREPISLNPLSARLDDLVTRYG